MRIDSAEALADRIRNADCPFRIVGSDTKSDWRVLRKGEPLHLPLGNGIRDWHPADMVVTVSAGMTLAALQSELATKAQTIPIPEEEFCPRGTVGGEIAMALPHRLESSHGSWRDWVLGMHVLLADGTVAKCGSRAVKNVAGYDLQRLFVGSRGSLGIILEVTLRTYPKSERVILPITPSKQANWIQRSSAESFDSMCHAAASRIVAVDPESSTLWAYVPNSEELPRYPGDWVLRSGCGERNISISDPTHIGLMRRAKQIFDPESKLNAGEWGFL